MKNQFNPISIWEHNNSLYKSYLHSDDLTVYTN